jgi:hypothetical protein
LISKFLEFGSEVVGQVRGHSFYRGGAIRKGPPPHSCGTGLGEFEDVQECGRGPIPSAFYASFFFFLSK